jgi:hypothetical protein
MGNNGIKKDDKVIVFTTNMGEKVAVNVQPRPPGPGGDGGDEYVVDCIDGDNVNVYLANIGNLPFNYPIGLPPCCMVNVTINQNVRVFSFPSPWYGNASLTIPEIFAPYSTYFDQNVTNLQPGMGGAVDWGVFVMFATDGEFDVKFNNEDSTNIILHGYDWGCPSGIAGSQDVCNVQNTTEEIGGLIYGTFSDYLASRGGYLYKDYITNPELMDGGNTITIDEMDSGYCDTTKVQIELRISRKEYLENPSKYQLIG